jgi:KipI family sensor histidine kinase inhibitor
LHASGVYTVGAVGFVPGFPYLLGLPKGLAIPRRSSPRPRVPAGSVAIAGGMAGIYPRVTPGGWWLLGTCAADRLPEFAVGDAVRFEIEP